MDAMDEHKAVYERLRKFDVSPISGFLPEVEPLKCLPDGFLVWEELIQSIPSRLHAQNIRTAVESMPVLDITSLTTSREQNRALLVLSIIGHAYVWGETPPATTIPQCVAKPWVKISAILERPPILAYDSICSQNWARFDRNKPVELGNIYVLNNFYGGIDEAWFYLVSVDIEARGAPALYSICCAQENVKRKNVIGLITDMRDIRRVILDMTTTLSRMSEHCSPWGFYHRVRKFLAGWTSHNLHNSGVVYENQFDNEPQKFHGGSAAQSSLLPSLDAVLGVSHHSKQSNGYLKEMRRYMPVAFRGFIESVENGPNVRDFVDQSSSQPLKEMFNKCAIALKEFRDLHIRIVCQYIINQSSSGREKGTGGTSILPFLKASRDETSSARVP
uniref:Dioxygenase n=1 Tax=Hirondellea gigas TaxID=1518452 RepID=A0A6A7GDR1_9CRUS